MTADEGSITGLASAKRDTQRFRNARRQRIARRVAVVAANEETASGHRVGRRYARGMPSLAVSSMPGIAIDPDLMRLEDRTNLVVVFLKDRVIHVVVAAGTAERHAQKGLAGMIDHVLHPLLTTEQLEVPREVASRADRVQIIRAGFVGSKHRDDHAIVGLDRD